MWAIIQLQIFKRRATMSQILFFILDGELDRVGGVRQASVEHLLPAGRWLKLNLLVWVFDRVCREDITI